MCLNHRHHATRRHRPRLSSQPHPLAGSALLAIVLLFIQANLASGGETLVHWEELDTSRLYSTYITLDRDLELSISALATFDRRTRHPIAYPWILDARTRRVRWTVDPDDPKTKLKRLGDAMRVRVINDTLNLAAGQYEIYYATFGNRFEDLALQKLLGGILGGRRIDLRDDWELLVECDDSASDAVLVGHRAKPKFTTLFRIPHPGDNAYEYELFRLDAPSKVLVYAIGEFDNDSRQFVDAGWIADAQTRRPIWEMTRRNTRPAGGGSKNRRFRGYVELPAGTYMLGYSSDDSHSYGDWNVNPPGDPEFWGIALFDPRGDVAPHWHAPVEDPFRSTLLVEIDRQRNTSFSRQGLRLKQPADLLVMCLGEQDNSEARFVDFGWIESLPEGKVVWTMTRHNTRPAGGADKNREAHETIHLGTGDYVVGYVTDDSHAFRDWNATPPRNPDRWGIQISITGSDFDRQSIELFDPEDRPYVLAELFAQGDESDDGARFTLDEPTTVRIVSMGEGLNGRMFDYGRMRRLGEGGRQGRTVWKMRYDDTVHAGGADKNRVVEGLIELESGSYELEYLSDDSHSFEEWNAAPPDRPHLWGVQAYSIQP